MSSPNGHVKPIDLRSDAVSQPTPAMRQAMAIAEVGDEQRREDPTILELERRVAQLFGLDDAVFLPSATMANQIALRVLTRPGDEVVAEANAHIFRNEAGGPAVHSGLAMARIDGRAGVFTGDDLRRAITRTGDPHNAQTSVVCIENTHNSSGGNVWTREEHLDVVHAARELGLAVHLDGARLLNACVALGKSPEAYTEVCDTVTLCISKGLGCPVGALLACRGEHVGQARRLKHLFGGAMRQAGFLAAAGLYALDHHVERLAEDHDNASHLARQLRDARVSVLNAVRSNVVLIDAASLGGTRESALERLEAAGVLCSKGAGAQTIRAMTHLGVDRAMVDEAVSRIKALLSSADAGRRLVGAL
jgi:threonine aldolase